MRCYFNVRSKADNKSLMEAGCHAKRAWSLANTECAMFWYDALTRTETVELRERSSQVDDSRRHRFANATHDNRNTSWLDASRHRSNNIQTSSDIQSTYTHTHTFNGPFSSTRKAKPIWILLKQETVSGSVISWAICKSAPRSRQITTPLSFLQAGCPSCHPTYSNKALKVKYTNL